jgi:hypothetical protein
MKELLDVKPVHLVSLPNVPPPTTGRLGPAAIGDRLNLLDAEPPRAGIKLKPFGDKPSRAGAAGGNKAKRNSAFPFKARTASA